MADENQSRNGEAVSSRTPRRSAASNKAWQTLMPHHKAAAAAADEMEEEDEEDHHTPAPPAARGASLRGKMTPAAATAAATARKTVAAAPAAAAPSSAASTPARGGAATAAAAQPPSMFAASTTAPRGLSDEEELEEASAELFPKPPSDPKKPAKRKGRPPKNGGGASGHDDSRGSSMASTPSMKKVKLEDDYEMEDEEEEEGEYGAPPMLNRQTSHTPSSSFVRRACSPTCTKRCCLTEDGKKVSRQTTTGVRSDQYDPPYNARQGGKRKPRAPKMLSDADSAADKKAATPRASYGSKKGEKDYMMKSYGGYASGGMGGGATFVGSSAPGARSMQAISAGRAVATMPHRPTATTMGGGAVGGGPMSRVVAIGPGGKVQSLARAPVTSPNMGQSMVVARPRVAGGSGAVVAGAGGAGMPRYPVAVASQHQQLQQQQGRLPGPAELVRAENTVNDQYRQARSAFAQHVVAGSSISEFNRVIDLLTVENKRLVQAQTEDQEYVDNLHRKIRSLENSVASLQRQLAVTTKAYHGAVCSSEQLLEVNADRNGSAPAPAAGGVRMVAARPTAPGAHVMPKTEKAEDADQKPPKDEEEEEGAEQQQQQQQEREGGQGGQGGGGEEGASRAQVASASVAKAGGGGGAPAASAAGGCARAVPRLMDQQQQQLQQQRGGGGGTAAAAAAQQLVINREQWMNEFDDEDEMYDEIMEEIEEEELAYFEDDIEDEEEMGLD